MPPGVVSEPPRANLHHNVAFEVEEEGSDVSEEVDVEEIVDIAEQADQHTAIASTINVENSSNVHVGPQTNYNGPVTLNQFVTVGKRQAGSEELYALPDIKGQRADLSDGVFSIRQLASYRSKHPRLTWGLLIAVIAIAIIISVALHIVLDGSSVSNKTTWPTYVSIPTVQPPPDEPPNPELVLNPQQQIYPRKFWSIYPPLFSRPLEHPTPYVVIAHSVDTTCSEPIPCSAVLRNIQAYHVNDFGSPDIGYNFIIDESGNVYEGRGWDRTDFFTDFVQYRNIGVCFLGNYVFIEFSEKQQKSLKDLLALGVKLKKLSGDYKLIAHSQTSATASPGKNILNVIDSWPHRCLSNCVIPSNITGNVPATSRYPEYPVTTDYPSTVWVTTDETR